MHQRDQQCCLWFPEDQERVVSDVTKQLRASLEERRGVIRVQELLIASAGILAEIILFFFLPLMAREGVLGQSDAVGLVVAVSEVAPGLVVVLLLIASTLLGLVLLLRLSQRKSYLDAGRQVWRTLVTIQGMRVRDHQGGYRRSSLTKLTGTQLFLASRARALILVSDRVSISPWTREGARDDVLRGIALVATDGEHHLPLLSVSLWVGVGADSVGRGLVLLQRLGVEQVASLISRTIDVPVIRTRD